MWSIVKRECRNYLKNPVFYIGAVLVFIGVYMQLKPYLQIGRASCRERVLIQV